jgi:ankyrin repeat protein
MNELFLNLVDYDAEQALITIRNNRTNPDIIGTPDDLGYTPLKTAIMINMPEVALALIETGLSKPEYISDDNNSILYDAIQQTKKNKEMEEVVFALLNTGEVDPGYIEYNDSTPLLAACMNNLPEIALKLIETGKSNPEYVNADGEDAITIAKRLKMRKVVDALIAILPPDEPDEIDETVDINMNEECFDFMDQSDKPIANFLSDDTNNIVLIFYTDNVNSSMRVGFNRTYFTRDETNYIIYECKQVNTMRPDNIIKKIEYFDIKALCGSGDLITKRVFDMMKESSERIFVFKRRQNPLLTTVSLKLLEDSEYPSSRQCKETDNSSYVYNLVANVNEVGKRQRKGGSKKRTKRRRTKRHKTYKRRTNKRRTNKRIK